MRNVSLFFSFVFHPVFTPLYAVFFYFKIENYQNRILSLDNNLLYVMFSLMIIIGIVFPFISLFIMRKTRMISDFTLTQRKERIPVLIIVILYYAMVYFMYRTWNENYLNLPTPFDPLMSFLFAGLIILALATIITIKFKISLHNIAVSGMAGGFLALTSVMSPINNLEMVFQLNAFLLIIMGVVGSSRLFLKAHSLKEVIAGMMLGFAIEYVVVINQWSI